MILPWQWKSITMVVKCVIALNWTLKPELIYYLTFMSIKFSTKGPTFYQIIKNWCLYKNIIIIIILALYGWCCSAFLQSINMAACPRGFRVVGQNCTANYPSPPPHHNRQQLHSFTIIIFIFSKFHRFDYDVVPGRLLISFLKVQHKRLMPSSWIYHYMVVQRTS